MIIGHMTLDKSVTIFKTQFPHLFIYLFLLSFQKSHLKDLICAS